MTKVYTNGLYHYEIIGHNEKEAADEMERCLDFLRRSHYGGEIYLDELSDIRHRISAKYDVEITAV